jgi:hypothetical protein
VKVGIVGFPGVGKSTIFAALSGAQKQMAPHAGRADRPGLGVVKVPDPRLDVLARMYQPRKVTPAEVCFVDFAGRAASRTALDASQIAEMRDFDAFALVVRGFPNVLGEPPTPTRELRAFTDELVLADLAVIEKRLERLRKEKGSDQERALLGQCEHVLQDGRPLRLLVLRADEERLLSPFAFVSRKPLLVVINGGEEDIGRPLPQDLETAAAALEVQMLAVCGQTEMEVEELPAEERGGYLHEIGITEGARARVIRASYALLSLVSFLTVGADEVRAWPIRDGTTAVKAAGKVHSDIERGFIRAEVVGFEDLVRLGSEARCREAGVLRLEGRDYVVRDGDVIHFRFAV